MPIVYDRMTGFNALRFQLSTLFHTGNICSIFAGGAPPVASYTPWHQVQCHTGS